MLCKMAASTNEVKVKRSRIKNTIKRWTEDENDLVLDYLEDTIMSGHQMEKPTAKAYYERMIREKELENCNYKTVRMKVRNMLTKFKEALEWQRTTGQEIKETEGEASFQAVLLKRYPYQQRFENIWGEKLGVHMPFKTESSDIGALVDDMENEDCGIFTVEEDDNSGHSNFDSSSPAVDEDNPFVTPQTERDFEYVTLKCKTAKQSVPAHLEPACHCDRVGLEAQKLELRREALELKRHKFERQLELKRELKTRKLDFERERMDLRQQKIQVQRFKIETHKEIKLMELQIEKLKWERKQKEQSS